LPLLNPENWDDRNDSYFMAHHKQAQQAKALYALCAARCSETYHHWRIFTGGADGACLEIRRKPLENILDALPHVQYGEVDYLVLDRVEKLTARDRGRLPFLKRYGFTAEDEYRIVLEADEEQAAAHSIDFPLSLIGRIYLNPWLPKPIAESVIDTIRSIPGCEALSVQRSHLTDSVRWKNAGDVVIGRKAAKSRKKPLKLSPATAAKVKRAIKAAAARPIVPSPTKIARSPRKG
jgi:hypothetical protein